MLGGATGGGMHHCSSEMQCNTTERQGLRCFYLLLQRICSKKQRCAMLADVMMHRCNISVRLGVETCIVNWVIH